VSQPAFSMQIRELEHQVGAELVTRRQGVTLLTEAALKSPDAPARSSAQRVTLQIV
jgi:hypothetical protein